MTDDVYKFPYVLTERIVDLEERIGEEFGGDPVGEIFR